MGKIGHGDDTEGENIYLSYIPEVIWEVNFPNEFAVSSIIYTIIELFNKTIDIHSLSLALL